MKKPILNLKFAAPSIAALAVVSITTFTVLAAGPTGAPVSGNVDANFNSVSTTADVTAGGIVRGNSGIFSTDAVTGGNMYVQGYLANNKSGANPLSILDTDGVQVLAGSNQLDLQVPIVNTFAGGLVKMIDSDGILLNNFNVDPSSNIQNIVLGAPVKFTDSDGVDVFVGPLNVNNVIKNNTGGAVTVSDADGFLSTGAGSGKYAGDFSGNNLGLRATTTDPNGTAGVFNGGTTGINVSSSSSTGAGGIFTGGGDGIIASGTGVLGGRGGNFTGTNIGVAGTGTAAASIGGSFNALGTGVNANASSANGIGLRATAMGAGASEGVNAFGIGLGTISGSNAGTGVEGYSSTGQGMYAHSTSGVGIRASSTSNSGVSADSNSGSGVYATSASGTGVSAIGAVAAGQFNNTQPLPNQHFVTLATPVNAIVTKGNITANPIVGEPALTLGRASGQPSIQSGPGEWLLMDSTPGHYAGLNYFSSDNVILAHGGGNVGIGTTSPATALDISGSGASNIDLNVNGRISTGDGSNSGGVWVNSGHTMFMGNDSGKIGFWNGAGGWSLTDDTAGNVHASGQITAPSIGRFYNVTLPTAFDPSAAGNGATKVTNVGNTATFTFTNTATTKQWFISMSCLSGDQVIQTSFGGLYTNNTNSTWTFFGSTTYGGEPGWIGGGSRASGTTSAAPYVVCFSPNG